MSSKHVSKVLGLSVAASILAVSSSAFAGDLCKNVRFQVKNQRPVRIRIYKLEYFNRVNNQVQTERFTLECASGATCATNGDDLRDSEGVDLTNFVFFFNDQEADGDWSGIDRRTQPKLPNDEECRADRLYRGVPQWTINP